ncbi:MAG TPA: pitrilysin family protein [Oligoflexia bacterium]|nr:pitrilysin family protein [Oligoflexia bacterium]HMP27547.1 pitrilysin family protein [Oligoflexia bacterium]
MIANWIAWLRALFFSSLALVCFLVILLFAAACAKKNGATLPKVGSISNSAADFHHSNPVSWRLANGLKVLFFETNELPLVSGKVYFTGGSAWESAANLGSVSLMGEQLRQGGTKEIPPSELDRKLREHAATINSEFFPEYGSVSFVAPVTDFEGVFKLFADVIRKPRFDNERLEIAKRHLLEGINRRRENPEEIARLLLGKQLFGDYYLGRYLMPANVARLNRDLLLAVHSEFVRPNGAILTVYGDVSESNLREQVEKLFGDWPAIDLNGPRREAPSIARISQKTGVFFIEAPFPQATIIIGKHGPARSDPDRPAFDLVNGILGGGFGSLMMKKIRIELGLSYTAFSQIIPELSVGLNQIFLQTRPETVDAAIGESLKLTLSLQTQPLPDNLLSQVRNKASNSWIMRFENYERVLARKALQEILQVDPDYDYQYIGKVLGYSADDIAKIIAREWDLSKLTIAVVGDDRVYKGLENLFVNQSPPPPLNHLNLYRCKFTVEPVC